MMCRPVVTYNDLLGIYTYALLGLYNNYINMAGTPKVFDVHSQWGASADVLAVWNLHLHRIDLFSASRI